jgi:hypothetical protein
LTTELAKPIIFLTMTGTKNDSLSAIINWAARIIGLIVLIIFVIFVIGDTVDTIQQGNGFDVQSLYIILPVVIAIVGYVLGWWHKIIGGSLLVLVSIIFTILVAVAARSNLGPESNFHAVWGWVILGLPFLIIGGLFLISGYLDRKAAS